MIINNRDEEFDLLIINNSTNLLIQFKIIHDNTNDIHINKNTKDNLNFDNKIVDLKTIKNKFLDNIKINDFHDINKNNKDKFDIILDKKLVPILKHVKKNVLRI